MMLPKISNFKIDSILEKINLKLLAAILLFWGCLFVLVFVKNTHQDYPSPRSSLQESTIKKLKTVIHTVNTRQLVHNKTKSASMDFVIVIRVHENLPYLQYLITSLSQTPKIENTLLIFSHGWYRPAINHLIYNITFAKTMQIFYPFSAQTHPDEFPGPSFKDFVQDSPRNATQIRDRHHWWWTLTFVFNKVRILGEYEGLVLFLQEGDYLKEDFLHCLHLMKEYAYACPQCWFFALGSENWHALLPEQPNGVVLRRNVETLGLSFNRTVWNRVSRFGEVFCKFDDYSWVRAFTYLVKKAEDGVLTMTMVWPRLSRGIFCNDKCRRHFFENSHFPEDLETNEYFELAEYELREEGGWGDARDRALCMGM